jgi:hypothetical protein
MGSGRPAELRRGKMGYDYYYIMMPLVLMMSVVLFFFFFFFFLSRSSSLKAVRFCFALAACAGCHAAWPRAGPCATFACRLAL